MSYNARMKTYIKELSIQEINDLIRELKQPSFRVKQLIEWIYLKHVQSYDEMSNLPADLRQFLKENYPLSTARILKTQTSRDGTKKFILGFQDDACIEMVSIPSEDGRHTVCCSTQAGCAVGCAFCATGKEGFVRNLSIGEIVDQILIAREQTNVRVSNVVVMGQGEPFLNYNNTLEAMNILNTANLENIGARHITISTCGIIPGIKKLAQEQRQYTLAISLHAADQSVRDSLMPGVSKYTLKELRGSLLDYVQKTNRRITLEYVMLKGINDKDSDLDALVEFCKDLLCHVNLIPLNRIEGSSFQPSSTATMNAWQHTLMKYKTEATIRNSRGSDIAGACGQLKNVYKASN